MNDILEKRLVKNLQEESEKLHERRDCLNEELRTWTDNRVSIATSTDNIIPNIRQKLSLRKHFIKETIKVTKVNEQSTKLPSLRQRIFLKSRSPIRNKIENQRCSIINLNTPPTNLSFDLKIGKSPKKPEKIWLFREEPKYSTSVSKKLKVFI